MHLYEPQVSSADPLCQPHAECSGPHLGPVAGSVQVRELLRASEPESVLSNSQFGGGVRLLRRES
jgi:hypothetical protein